MSVREVFMMAMRSAGMRRKTYRLYHIQWGNKKGPYNFGDMLSPYICEQIAGKGIPVTDKRDPYKIVAVGSLINNKTVRSGGVFWGTGMHEARVDYYKPVFPTIFRAVRGPLTRERLIGAGYDCPPIYGDPALLLPKFYKPAVSKKYPLGCIAHSLHADSLTCSGGVRRIDVRISNNSDAEIHRVIDEINRCEAIISSSLHGIIVANAYGIPARYMRVSGLPLEGLEGLKFNDYFRSVGMPEQTPAAVPRGAVITEEYSRLVPRTVDLKIDLKLLLDSFPGDLTFA